MSELTKQRPKFLNLAEIKLPLPGLASILHRISGVGIFLMLPLLIWLLDMSLRSVESFQAFQTVTGNIFVKLVLIGLLWAFMHHLCMGIRVLLIDMHIGVEKTKARASAKAVFVVSILMTLILGARLW